MKSLKLIVSIFILVVLLSNITFAQTTYKKKIYPQYSITPSGGIILPVGILADNFKPGPTIGLDFGYRLNKEVGFYAKVGYYFFNSKITGAPVGHYLEYTTGPRYFFTKPNLKSSLFLEAGVGGFTFMQDSFINPNDTLGTVVAQISDTRPGVNAGVGANIGLSNSLDLMVKAKYNILFTPNGSSSFITALGGFEFKF